MTASTRDDYREVILSNSVCNSTILPFKGKDVEFKHLTIDEMLSLGGLSNSERFARMLIASAHVPETGEKIFEDADLSVLSTLTYTPEITKLQEFFGKMFEGDEAAAKKS